MLSIFGLPFHIAYAASKGGIVQLTRAFAEEWSKHGITANAIGPGFFPTAIGAGLVVLGLLLLVAVARGERFEPQEAEPPFEGRRETLIIVHDCDFDFVLSHAAGALSRLHWPDYRPGVPTA